MTIEFIYEGKYEAPKVQTTGSAGLDLFNNTDKTIIIPPMQAKVVDTGVKVAIPKGKVGLVIARSSLGFKYNATLVNSVGVIDSDYRGEVKAKVINLNNQNLFINPGERFCQLVVTDCYTDFKQTEELSETERGGNGFGSTGQ